MLTDAAIIARKKAKALALIYCLLRDKPVDSKTMADDLAAMAGDPDVARQLLDVFASLTLPDAALDAVLKRAKHSAALALR